MINYYSYKKYDFFCQRENCGREGLQPYLCFAGIILISGMKRFSSAVFLTLKAEFAVVRREEGKSDYISPDSPREVTK